MARKRTSDQGSGNQTGTLVADLDKPTSVPCPFKIVIDTREQTPFDFPYVESVDEDAAKDPVKDDGLPAVSQEDDPYRYVPYDFSYIESNADTNRLPFAIETVRFGLDVGDYSLIIDENDTSPARIRIERKSKGDLFGSVAKRENFEWRLERMDTETESAHVVVEAEWSEIISKPPKFSDYNPTSLHRTVQSWTHRYRNVHWHFYPGRDAAEMATFWLLYHFYRNVAFHKAAKDRAAANHKAYLKGMMGYRSRIKINDCPIPRQHAVGDPADHWATGWLDMEALAKGKIR